MVNGMGMMKTEEILSMDMAMMVGEGKEMMVHLRLFYLGVVHGKNDRMEVENKTLGRGAEDDGEETSIPSLPLLWASSSSPVWLTGKTAPIGRFQVL